MKIAHLMYMPLLGLGLYNGYRGDVFLKNRIKILLQFVIPSLQAQTSKNFILWISVRFEDKNNKRIIALKKYLDEITEFKTVFTYSGVAFFDDKYPDDVARLRLINAIHGSMGTLLNTIGDCDEVLMTIQPSDDCYHKEAVDVIQLAFKNNPELQGFGFSKGYICNYLTKEIRNYDPETNPPFYTIRFPREIFIDPLKHIEYTSLKQDVGKYKKGTALPSHEYVKYCLNYQQFDYRGFLVGCHSDNISTHFNIPYAGEKTNEEVLSEFGLKDVPVLKVKVGLRRRIMRSLPHKVQRKLRYWWGEKLRKII